ncbi:uncharacterized protein LOC117178359 [Belonocnema kinseyi]|uniref:uncharacterized protein LOC117178359 n=1 Tax=Belonocnema kinseyi TaxID=2817044 RepID=UPI00143DC1CE|nr:uncharacterized protein LOC117178359 [Belonocnema kinseyi]
MVEMQLRNVNKSVYGRRFTNKEKNLALSFYKQSPALYLLMKSLLILSSVTCVKRQLSKIELDTGINSNVAEVLRAAAEEMQDDKENTLVLMWDEAFLSSHIWYDMNKDKIMGFEDFGNKRTSFFTDHILTFMI